MTTLSQILSKINECEELEMALPLEAVGQMHEKIDDYYKLIRHLESLQDKYEAEIGRLEARYDATTAKISRIKDHLIYQMEAFNWEKLVGNMITASIKKSQRVKISETADFEDPRFSRYTRKRVAVSWDKNEIKKALEEGEDLKGLASLSQSKTVSFK